MHVLRLFALSLPMLLHVPAPCQGTPYSGEVDNLIRGLRATARPDGSLGDGSTLLTARVLACMGNSHRFYAVADGPIVQPQLNCLFKRRSSVGAFDEPGGKGSAAVTQAVLEALEAVGPAEYAQDLLEGRAWLKEHKAEAKGPLAARVAELEKLAAGPDGAQAVDAAGKAAAAGMRRGMPQTADGKPDHAAAIAALEQLVAQQILARRPKAPQQGRAPQAQQQQPSTPQSQKAALGSAQQKGLDFLTKCMKDGKLLAGPPGKEAPSLELTAMAAAALQTKAKEARSKDEQQTIASALDWIASTQTEAGSFGTENVNYVTCAGIYALARSGDDKYREVVQKAQRFILSLQHVERLGYAQSDRDYGSIGYGSSERGDLSNLNFALEGLRASGLSVQDEAFQKAVTFLQRTQNLRAVNDFNRDARDDASGERFKVASGDDGGAVYYPGNSPAGYVQLDDGSKVARSYGSMTYALLKAYTLCGVKPEDPRVQAAVGWIQKNWTLDENPGADAKKLGDAARFQGLFYYYMVLAQALDLVGLETVKTNDAALDWRKELKTKLEAMQRPDGSWVNDKNGRWWESMPQLCTIYALLALERCR